MTDLLQDLVFACDDLVSLAETLGDERADAGRKAIGAIPTNVVLISAEELAAYRKLEKEVKELLDTAGGFGALIGKVMRAAQRLAVEKAIAKLSDIRKGE